MGIIWKSLLNLWHYTSVVYVPVFWPQDLCNLSSPIWNRTWSPSFGRWRLNQWTAREIPQWMTLDDGSTFVCLRNASPSNSWDICIVLFFFFIIPKYFPVLKKKKKKTQARPCFGNSFLRIEKQRNLNLEPQAAPVIQMWNPGSAVGNSIASIWRARKLIWKKVNLRDSQIVAAWNE